MHQEAQAQQKKLSQLRYEEAEAAFQAHVQKEAERREGALRKLQLQAQKLEQELLADLERLAIQVGKEKGVSNLQVLKPGEKRQWSLWQLDLTSDLLEILKREK